MRDMKKITFTIEPGWSAVFADWLNSKIHGKNINKILANSGLSRMQFYRVRYKPSDKVMMDTIHKAAAIAGYKIEIRMKSE